MRLSHLHLNGRYVIIFSTKTGQERRVPIEQTTLDKIIKNHVKHREMEMTQKRATEPQRSDYLFPTLADVDLAPKRRDNVAPWGSNRNWLNHYYNEIGKAREKSNAAFND